MRNTLKDNYYWVVSEYSPVLVNAMKSLGGKWDSKAKSWKIKDRNKKQLFDILEDLYGHNGTDDYKKCDVVFELENYNESLLSVGLIKIAERKDRNYNVNLNEDCCVISGGFEEYGGSTKYPKLEPKENTQIKFFDFPVSMLNKIELTYNVIDYSPEDSIVDYEEKEVLSTEFLISELEKRGYSVSKNITIDESLLDA